MLYCTYKKMQTSSGKILFGCFAATMEEDNLKDFKFIFKEINEGESITTHWPWSFSDKGIHFWAEEAPIDLPEKVIEAIQTDFERTFSEEVDKFSNNNLIPELIYIDSEKINALLAKSIQEPSAIDIQMIKSIKLVQISSFFNLHPHLTFSFPLYLEYLSENKVSESDFTVEDFLERILENSALALN